MTYYTCNACDHSTFRLTEAIAHFAQYGGYHSFDYNGNMVITAREWVPALCREKDSWPLPYNTHRNHLAGGCCGR